MFKALKMKLAARRMERKNVRKPAKKNNRNNAHKASFWKRAWDIICKPFRTIGRWLSMFWKWVRSIDLIGLVNITLLSAIIVLFSMLIMDIVGCNKKPVVIIAQNDISQQVRVSDKSAPRIVRNRNAQKVSSLNAAVAGVYLHGLAGDIASKDLSEYSVMASNIIDYIPFAIRETTIKE